MITSCFGCFEDATFVRCDIDKIGKEKKNVQKQRTDTSEGITRNVLHLRVALKRRCKDAFFWSVGQLHCKDNLFSFFKTKQ